MPQQQTIAMVNNTDMPNFDVDLVATVKKALKATTFNGQHGEFTKQMFVVEDDTGSCILDLKNPPRFMATGAVIRIAKCEAKAAPKRETYEKDGDSKGKIVATGLHIQLVSGAGGESAPTSANGSASRSTTNSSRSLQDAVEAYRMFLDEAFDLVADQVSRRQLSVEDAAAIATAQDIASSFFISWNRGEFGLAPAAAPAPAKAQKPSFTPDGSEHAIDDDDIPFN